MEKVNLSNADKKQFSVYYGGCWSTNIGNAFIDYGALHLMKQSNPLFYSERSPFYLHDGHGMVNHPNKNRYFNSGLELKPKFVSFSGMMACPQFFLDQKELLADLKKEGIPIILNGVGGESYTDDEIRQVRILFKELNIKGFISRDDITFDAYNDLFELSYKGIDCAFFVPEISRFNLLSNLNKNYLVHNNDDINNWENNLVTINSIIDSKASLRLIYSHHAPEYIKPWMQVNHDTMIAELPDEYIMLYSQSETTISTRVHACITTLAFGGKAFLAHNTLRASLFDVVGAKMIKEKPISLNLDLLSKKKDQHRNSLKLIIDTINKD